MRRGKLAVAAILVGLLLVIGLVGCGESGDAEAEANITDGVSERLEELKAGSGDAFDVARETLNSYVGGQLRDMGVSDTDLVSAYLEGFDYEVGDVTMTGSSASVHVTLTCRSVSDIVKDFAARSRGMSDSEAGAVLMQCVENAEPTQSEADVYVQKAPDGSWDTLDGLKSSLVKLCI